jgi:5-methylcytosine-specific restriction endonuclease McrA
VSVETNQAKSLYGGRWRRYRLAQLQRNPLCRFCYDRGLIVPATVVDHIVRHAGHADPLFWNTANLQSLCKPCHDSVKQQIDRHGWARGYDEQGLPLYPDPQRLDRTNIQRADHEK